MTLYNFTSIMQANSTLEYLTATTDTISWLPIGFVVAIFAVLMLSFRSDDIPTLLMIAGFFTTSISGLLWLAGYMPFMIVIFCLVITVVGFFGSYFTGGGS